VDDLYTLLSRVEPHCVVLDLGCGHGSFHYETCRGRIVAMDVALPEKAGLRPQAMYIRADSAAIPISNHSVDVVVCHHTLEHFPNYKTTLEEIRRILRPTGWLWIAVPNGSAFDDNLYRFLFAGGGHVNRFDHDKLVSEVEALTETRLIQSCDLFSSFIYLRRPTDEELKHYPARAGFLGEIPAGFLTFSVFALNALTRLLDKSVGTRYSQYGWGFVFARTAMPVEPMPSYFNVCRQCGSGNSWASLNGPGRSLLGIRFSPCPNCGEMNVCVSPPADLQ
jgi:predicted SAM-dependent methyltransferase